MATPTSLVVGDIRVTALSLALVRIEPRGPKGFEDRTTFNVVGRHKLPGLPLSLLNSSAEGGTWLGTEAYQVHIPSNSNVTNVTVSTPDGRVLWRGANSGDAGTLPLNHLHWPSPLTAVGYAYEDRPRFHEPAWGPTPIPRDAKVDPALLSTNGYDFNNNATGDMMLRLHADVVLYCLMF